MSRSETAEQDSRGLGSGGGISAPAIGKLRAITGSVTITRAGLILAESAIGDPVYEGDVIETGNDGLVAIAFADGTAFHLYADGRVELAEGDCGVKKSAISAPLRVVRGLFGFIAGKLAASGRVFIDTPFGQVRNKTLAAGFGSVAFGVFTFALVRELKADSADISFIDYGTIDYKDLKYGIFELHLYGDPSKGILPSVVIVSDPTKTLVVHKGGSASFEENTPAQMAQLQSAYANAFSAYSQGLQDPFFQQWQHANAQPQSNPGGNGSSTEYAYLFQNNSFNAGQQNTVNPGGNVGGLHGGSGAAGGSGSSGGSGGSGPQPTPTASWNGEGDGKNWGDPANWTDSYAPLSWQDLTIGSPFVVTIDSGDEEFRSVRDRGQRSNYECGRDP